jgi:hypothetical protein
MDATERDIYYYLKAHRQHFLPLREISRRTAGKKRFQNAPDWARPILEEMVRRGIAETDKDGAFRLKPMPKPEAEGKVWVAPHLAKILKASGKPFDHILTPEDEDEYYDRL